MKDSRSWSHISARNNWQRLLKKTFACSSRKGEEKQKEKKKQEVDDDLKPLHTELPPHKLEPYQIYWLYILW